MNRERILEILDRLPALDPLHLEGITSARSARRHFVGASQNDAFSYRDANALPSSPSNLRAHMVKHTGEKRESLIALAIGIVDSLVHCQPMPALIQSAINSSPRTPMRFGTCETYIT